jgi:hypothetical protein
MVILLQLCIFLLFAAARRSFVFGKHLSPSASGSNNLSYTNRARSVTTARHIGVVQTHGIAFIVRRERWYHRLLKAMGIASEVRTGNAGFDESYFITTDHPGHLEELLASPDLKECLHKLFSMPVTSLHATPHKMWCEISREDRSKNDDHFASHWELLHQISRATGTSVANTSGDGAARKLGWAAALVVAVHAGLFSLGVFGFLPTFVDSVHTLSTRDLMAMGAIAGAIAGAAWFLGVVMFFRASSWAPWVMADFVLAGVIGFMLSGIFFVREANIWLPQAAATVHELPVVSKSCTLKCGKGRRSSRRSSYQFDSDRDCNPQSRQAIMASKKREDQRCVRRAKFEYRVELRHWREPGQYAFKPDADVFDTLRTGSYLQVPVHAGALGLEWIDWDELRAR